ncbi:uncharacterized protein SPSK_00029 [Sporothrix schenckii 1099-18]|uniref:Uncharacterized protein n=2 Tax=Sporothrix schenckii TaxID=29908 RepID=U7PMP1_SPOS1|nr:uncharacterized protein SPSK_00029 [Sporothrix schenckii 1099-18]ERS96852.1 hypothetical protein HMPREF1624_07061 [Sporothrix schenckii ATCC 58251]KJR79838.1 hypothetical protein SPSK_00029 [Sporothrix schenckii 1099-18]
MSHSGNHHYPHNQQPTPPSSGMQYAYENASEAPPITGQPSVAPAYDMSSYSYQSPKEEGLPTTMDSYQFGSYTATAPSHPDETTGSPSVYSYSPAMNAGSSQYLTQAQQRLPPPGPAMYSPYGAPPTQHGHQQQQHPQHPQGLAPLLSHPRPMTYRTDRTMASDYSSMAPIASLAQAPQSTDVPGGSNYRRLPPATVNDQSRTPRTQAGSIGDVSQLFQANGTADVTSPNRPRFASDSFRKALTPDKESLLVSDTDEIKLNHQAPEQAQFIFNQRQTHSSLQGKGLWEYVASKFQVEFPDGQCSNARLQMTLTRARRRFARYPKYMLENFMMVYEREEKAKYVRYAKMLNDINAQDGKSKSFEWKPADVESIACRIGFEEPAPDPNTSLRNRRNITRKKLQAASSSQRGRAQSTVMAPVWSNNGYMPGNQQYPLPSPHQAHADEACIYNIEPADLTEEQSSALADTLALRHGSNDYAEDALSSGHSNSPIDQSMDNATPQSSTSTYSRTQQSPSPGGTGMHLHMSPH